MDFVNTGTLAEIFAPMQIMVVLVIALIVFGPKKLPELGKSLGTALRDLNKAKNDMMRSFSLDHEPDREPYRPDQYTETQYNGYNSPYHYTTPETPDLTDYTIAGIPPKEIAAIEGSVARSSNGNGYDSGVYADYTIVSQNHNSPAAGDTVAAASDDTHTGPSGSAEPAAAQQGEHHV